MYLHATYDYDTLTVMIVGHRYVSVIMRRGHPATRIFEEAKAFVEDLGQVTAPFVVISCHRIYGDDFDNFVGAEIADIVLE